jgi:hypothetical protein
MILGQNKEAERPKKDSEESRHKKWQMEKLQHDRFSCFRIQFSFVLIDEKSQAPGLAK